MARKQKRQKKIKKSSNHLFFSIIISVLLIGFFFVLTLTGQIQLAKEKARTLADSIVPSFATLGDCNANHTCASNSAVKNNSIDTTATNANNNNTKSNTTVNTTSTSKTSTKTTKKAKTKTKTTATGYVRPSSNNCKNANYTRYIRMTPLRKNFGDPQCNFTKSKLYTLLKQKDPKHAAIFFLTIVRRESGYNPNAYNGHTPDPHGAWGLYQMGSSRPPGKAPPAAGKNGRYDRGDVNWQIQTTNAVLYNTKVIHCNFRYWSTASGYWGKYHC